MNELEVPKPENDIGRCTTRHHAIVRTLAEDWLNFYIQSTPAPHVFMPEPIFRYPCIRRSSNSPWWLVAPSVKPRASPFGMLGRAGTSGFKSISEHRFTDCSLRLSIHNLHAIQDGFVNHYVYPYFYAVPPLYRTYFSQPFSHRVLPTLPMGCHPRTNPL